MQYLLNDIWCIHYSVTHDHSSLNFDCLHKWPLDVISIPQPVQYYNYACNAHTSLRKCRNLNTPSYIFKLNTLHTYVYGTSLQYIDTHYIINVTCHDNKHNCIQS